MHNIMVAKARSVAIGIVFGFVCFLTVSESRGTSECSDVMNFRTQGPFFLASVTLSVGFLRGDVDFEMKYRVHQSKVQRGSVELQGESDDYMHAAANAGDLTYITKFPFRDVRPYIVYIRLNGQTICSSPNDYDGNTRTFILNHSFTVATRNRPWIPQPMQPPPPQPTPDYPETNVGDADNCGIVSETLKTSKIGTLLRGGHKVGRGEWPWSVALFHLPGFIFKCGATIVTRRHVVTAAHCVITDDIDLRAEQVILKIGAYNLTRFIEAESKITPLRSIVMHNEYNRDTHANDLAMLTTKDPISFTDYIKPICLWDGNPDLSEIVGQKAVVTGWGKTDTNEVSSVLLQLTVPVVSLEDCRSSHEVFRAIAVHKTLCAGRRDETGPCNGDSGGGLFLHVAGRWKLRAIVSVSTKNVYNECEPSQYVLYTDLAQYSNWIQNEIN